MNVEQAREVSHAAHDSLSAMTVEQVREVFHAGCESILAVTASWLVSVCGFYLCGIRR